MRTTQTLKDAFAGLSFITAIYCAACAVLAAGALLGFVLQG